MTAYRRMMGEPGLIAAALYYCVCWGARATGFGSAEPFWAVAAASFGWLALDLWLNRQRPA